jgi:[ribosomal protein S5]-alanine N-acetyltransferase
MAPLLRTERLDLRAWQIEDAEDAFAMYGDPDVVRFLGGAADLPIPDLDTQKAWLAGRLARWAMPEFTGSVWAAADRATDRVVGTMLLKPLVGSRAGASDDEGRFEIGWHLVRRAWGRGLASEGAQAVLRHAFEARELTRVYAVVAPDNARSIRVAEKIGMRWIETTREYYGGEALELFAIDRVAAPTL